MELKRRVERIERLAKKAISEDSFLLSQVCCSILMKQGVEELIAILPDHLTKTKEWLAKLLTDQDMHFCAFYVKQAQKWTKLEGGTEFLELVFLDIHDRIEEEKKEIRYKTWREVYVTVFSLCVLPKHYHLIKRRVIKSLETLISVPHLPDEVQLLVHELVQLHYFLKNK